MAYIFTYTHPDCISEIHSGKCPAEYVGFVGGDSDAASRKVEAAMPKELKEAGYKIGMSDLCEPPEDSLFFVKANEVIRLDDLSEDRRVWEFLNIKAD